MEWTEFEARRVLSAGDMLHVEHPAHEGKTLNIRGYKGGKFLAYFQDENGDDTMSLAGRFGWGEFTIVGFAWTVR